jgi:predicted MFS family arabinose efflux permease
MVLAMFATWPGLLRTRSADGDPHFAWPRGVVLVIAALTAIMFLAEGALLDWSALLITGGFILIGLGAANVVPVLFRRAGSQTVMPPVLAIAAITTMGYAGILLGPAIIGFVADHIGLTLAFWMIPVMLLAVPLSVAVVAPRARRSPN